MIWFLFNSIQLDFFRKSGFPKSCDLLNDLGIRFRTFIRFSKYNEKVGNAIFMCYLQTFLLLEQRLPGPREGETERDSRGRARQHTRVGGRVGTSSPQSKDDGGGRDGGWGGGKGRDR